MAHPKTEQPKTCFTNNPFSKSQNWMNMNHSYEQYYNIILALIPHVIFQIKQKLRIIRES